MNQSYAELIINIEAPLSGTFHYFIPPDLKKLLQIGHLVEVEFGNRMAQAIVVRFTNEAAVEDLKPIIALIDPQPVLLPSQIELAEWMSHTYLTAANGCIRLMLPPGLTRWSDYTVDRSPYTELSGRITDNQQLILDILEEKGVLRGRQLLKFARAAGIKSKKKLQSAVNQLVKRKILRKASVLDPPRSKPKKIKVAQLIATPDQIKKILPTIGRSSKKADLFIHLINLSDPLPTIESILKTTSFTSTHISQLEKEKIITIYPEESWAIPQSTETVDPTSKQLITATPTAQLSATQIDEWLAAKLITINNTPATLSISIPEPEWMKTICTLRSATKYYHIIAHLSDLNEPTPLTQLYTPYKATLAHLKKLASLDLIKLSKQEIWRDPLADRDFVPASPPPLTTDQARIWGQVKIGMILADEHETAPKPILLHGVTGSGKTEIYMRAIDFAIEEGKSAIVLVPEIALTPQTVRRFAARFPDRVAMIHSRLTDGERYDSWRRAREGEFDIVIGPRSALFTPLPNLGVIILDEEHDPSYKQTPPIPPPYYHTRETAIALAKINNATLILGSATPDLVTYHRARSGHIQLLELPKRVMGHRQRLTDQAVRLQRELKYQHITDDPDDAFTIPLPPIQVVDLRQELRAGNRSIFSRALQTAMDETLERKEQAILFLNRRGSATFVICRDCGHTLKCPRCDIPLTYHRPNAALTCHHCGRQEKNHNICPQCGSKRIKFFGLGTEELERLVSLQWPQARVVRWDRDTTAGRDSHEKLLASFIHHESDILIGTQMIAKGLDLPLVTLVGIISADTSLSLPDYRTGERAFQLLAQVAGRAGRGLLGGRVILQTYQPDHYAIQAAAQHDFITFYLDEIRFRTQHKLPPFRRMARLIFTDPSNYKGEQAAKQLASSLKRYIREHAPGRADILGPTPPFFSRIDGRYRWQILLRAANPTEILRHFPIPSQWVVDIDPVSTL